MPILYSLSIKKMPFGNKSGLIYATAHHRGIVKCEDLAAEIAKMSQSVDKYTAMAVIDLLAQCIRRRLLDGYRVEAGALGDFYAVLKCDGADEEKNYAESKIKDVRVKWAPGKLFTDLMRAAKFRRAITRKATDEGKRMTHESLVASRAAAQREAAAESPDASYQPQGSPAPKDSPSNT